MNPVSIFSISIGLILAGTVWSQSTFALSNADALTCYRWIVDKHMGAKLQFKDQSKDKVKESYLILPSRSRRNQGLYIYMNDKTLFCSLPRKKKDPEYVTLSEVKSSPQSVFLVKRTNESDEIIVQMADPGMSQNNFTELQCESTDAGKAENILKKAISERLASVSKSFRAAKISQEESASYLNALSTCSFDKDLKKMALAGQCEITNPQYPDENLGDGKCQLPSKSKGSDNDSSEASQ